MNPAHNKYELEVTTPGDREIAMTRTFDASPSMLYDAFAKPELIRRWLLGPDGYSMPDCEVDLRVGGAFHYVWRNDADGSEFGMHGVYRELVRAERIVHAENFDEPWYPGDCIVTTTFVARGQSTVVTMTSQFATSEARDGALASGMTRGVAASFDRLEATLE
jgi:uncharacterized protein YndB with AHSA1/START domain